MTRPADFRSPHRSARFRVPIAFALATTLAMLLAQMGGHAATPPPDALLHEELPPDGQLRGGRRRSCNRATAARTSH